MMIIRFTVLNKVERDDFEKKFQMPYGYGTLPIFYKMESAYDYLQNLDDKTNMIIEKFSDGCREIMFGA